MEIEPFALERWFARHEHGNLMLAESGVRSLPASRFDTDPGELGYVVPTDGDPSFRAEVADRYGRGADEVCFTCGTQEANFVALAALMGEHAVVVTPTYQSLHALPAAFGEVTRVELPPPDWTLDPGSFCERLVGEGVVLAPGDCFGYPAYVRIGFGPETDRLEDRLSRVDAFPERNL